MVRPAEPLIPKVGDTQASQRLLTGVNELTRTLIRSGAFLVRQEIGKLIIAKDGDATSKPLVWGALNRAAVPFAMTVALPPIRSEWVGVPLYLANTSDQMNTLSVIPSGRALDGRGQPTINGLDTYNATMVGLYVFITDGQNWFVRGT